MATPASAETAQLAPMPAARPPPSASPSRVTASGAESWSTAMSLATDRANAASGTTRTALPPISTLVLRNPARPDSSTAVRSAFLVLEVLLGLADAVPQVLGL